MSEFEINDDGKRMIYRTYYDTEVSELALALAKNRKWEDEFLKLRTMISMQQTVKRELLTILIEFIDESLEELKHE